MLSNCAPNHSTHSPVRHTFASVSILLRSITQAPTATCSTASRPAVRLQSRFSFFVSSVAFLLHLYVPVFSLTLSMHGISIAAAQQSSIEILACLARWEEAQWRMFGSLNLSTTGILMTLSCNARMLCCEGYPCRYSSSIKLNT